MTPGLKGIDHAHVYVGDRAQAERWYHDVLGFTRIDEFIIWAKDGGPLTVANAQDNVHLALFERDGPANTTALAVGATGEAFLAWREHLQAAGLELSLTDHQLVYSMYFRDPWDNLHEITTHDRDFVVQQLAASS